MSPPTEQLIEAAECGPLQRVEALLGRGASCWRPARPRRQTPWRWRSHTSLLLAHGARRDVRDTVWGGTPLDWAIHEGRQRARASLEGQSELAS